MPFDAAFSSQKLTHPRQVLQRFGTPLPAQAHAPTREVKNASMFTTIAHMRAAALKGAKDMGVRSLSEELCKDIPQGDYSSECLALYYYVCQHVRYMRDIDGVEFLKDPDKVLASRSGDCDDMATLLAAMLMSIGNPCQFAIFAFGTTPQGPRWSHVCVQVKTPGGDITLDPVANRITPQMHGRTFARKVFPLRQGPGTVDAGIGLAGVGSSSSLYSVYDYHRGLYDYFEGPVTVLPATGKYRAPRGGTSRHGVVPEGIAAALPFSARKTGSGKTPVGMIASKASLSLGLVPAITSNKQLLTGIALGAFGLYAYQRWGKQWMKKR